MSGRLLFAGYDDFECKVRWLNISFEYVTDLNRFGTRFEVIKSAHSAVMKTESVVLVSVMMASVFAQDHGIHT